ncbi:MAG: O-antigen ligase family protein [Victivallales bacterium]|jgi:O-antigen ligase|nr:O-antigen ligase family protein [Victivallales bacterium]
MKKFIGYIAAIFIGGLTLLLPIKFASLAVMPEMTSFFPDDWFSYFYITFPAQSFGIFTGFALLLTLLSCDAQTWQSLHRTSAGRTTLLWAFALPLAALPGLIHCDTPDYAIWEIFHLAGIGAYILSFFLLLSRHAQWRKIYVWLLVAGAFYAVYAGLRQYFVGFDEMREFTLQQYRNGIQLSSIMQSKLEDDRVFGSFASCNVLAGYLILLLPLVGWKLWRFGENFDPAKVSKPLLAAIGVGLLAIVLFLTRGRGALLAAVLTAGTFVLTLPMRKIWRIGAVLAAITVIISGAFYARYAGRGFASMEERVDYLKTSAQMVMEQPLLGYGWGGFFYRHMQLKTSDTDEAARDPHNLVASFATQAGIPAGLLIIVMLIYPMWQLGKQILSRSANGFAQAVFWGEMAFFLHALMDVDLQIPANMAISGGLLIAALIRPESQEPQVPTTKLSYLWLLPTLLLGVATLGGSYYIIRSEIAFDRLMTLIQPQSTEQLKIRSTPAEVEKRLKAAVFWRPFSPFPWECAGDFYLGVRDYRSAERCFNEAQKCTDSRPSTYARLAQIELRRGNAKKAKELIAEAHRRFPGNPRYAKALKDGLSDTL